MSEHKLASKFGNLMLDYEQLFSLAEINADKYQTAAPFPHIVLDDFISDEVLDALLDQFPAADLTLQQRNNNLGISDSGQQAQRNKQGIRAERQFSPAIRQFCWELNSPSFLEFLQKLTGIPYLLNDPEMLGGGTHQILTGGMLKVHVDFCTHRHFKLERRLNLLIYLNKNWQDAFGGHLELWDRDVENCLATISPIAKRCVIFNTGAKTWHGHPKPLTCPPDRTRKSIAMYYYTNGRPPEEAAECTHGQKTLWKDLPGDG